MELRKRLGGDWLAEPWAYALYTYYLLTEQDRRDAWVARMARIEGAELMAMAFHDPKRLGGERRKALASAAAHVGRIDDAEIEQAKALMEALERSGAMCDTPEEIAEHYRKYPRPVS